MLEVKIEETVAASATAVWDLMRDFGGVLRWSPSIKSCTVEGEGVGAVRTLDLSGMLIKERLEAFDESAKSFQYSIVESPLPLANYLSTFTVRTDGAQAHVTWGSTFDPGEMPPEQATKMVEGIYREGLKGVRHALGI